MTDSNQGTEPALLPIQESMVGVGGPVFVSDATCAERSKWLQTLCQLPIFVRAKAETLETLLKTAHFETIEPKNHFYRADEPVGHVYILIEGYARAYQQGASGAQFSQKILRAPTHFGDLAAFAGLPTYRSHLQALSECVYASFPVHAVESALASDHALCRAWLYSFARQHSVAIDSTRQLIFGDLYRRLANVLRALSPEDADGDGEATVAASYADLAQHAGCTRRSAIRAMKDLLKRGAVSAEAGVWRVKAPLLDEALEEGRVGLLHSLLDNPKLA